MSVGTIDWLSHRGVPYGVRKDGSVFVVVGPDRLAVDGRNRDRIYSQWASYWAKDKVGQIDLEKCAANQTSENSKEHRRRLSAWAVGKVFNVERRA